ncbi:molybdopterin-dependent oxidoreductase [Stagnihabitans tardus]|uniref:Molybdopterin-dependent oxidoreductase n=1 Tax=Stagnihabitans tardus TaxID=2699202 RepID=A0AAE4YEE2_9RHOB|nr:molybdopterin-dependent oxidoreductase [Stagnihabitans tardus]NBZ88360.1 molybdopterin-dependent oxidoreductase [Stagnihabitans tardus]
MSPGLSLPPRPQNAFRALTLAAALALAPPGLGVLWGLPAQAQTAAQTQPSSPVPQGPVILTVSGLDPEVAADGLMHFDREALAALGPVRFTTSSIWTEGRHEFTGIPLATLAQALKIDSKARIVLRALNHYQVEMPLAEARPGAPILAYEFDGKPMSIRDKGPIWVVYPYDADPKAYQTVTAFARSVWQLDHIEVLP